jgi:iron complex transport system substrate-binding protein
MLDTRHKTQDARRESETIFGRRLFTFLTGAFLLFSISCSNSNKNEKSGLDKVPYKKHVLNPVYAKGFTVYENDIFIRFTSRNPDDTTKIYSVLEFKKSELPFKKICITSTTHAFLFDAIKASSSITGMSAMIYLQDSALKATYARNKVVELGKDDNLNREVIIATQPEILMVYPYDGCDYSAYEKAGITVVYNAEYLEQDPLGRTEWIKLAGLLVGKNKESLAQFKSVENNYNEYKNLIATMDKSNPKPIVILGKPIDNIWYVPGNKSFACKLIKDAGGQYAFEEVDGNNVKTQSMEWILMRAEKANYWIFTDYSADEITLKSLKTQNKAYRHLNPFKLKNVFVCNSAKADYFGKAVIEPHILLKDLIHHFYNTDSTYKPAYFKKTND